AMCIIYANSPTNQQIWSTYQKLEYEPPRKGRTDSLIYANSVMHQFLTEARIATNGFYGRPYAIHPEKPEAKLDEVLIIGAGSGTDVAVALANGAKSIDAVEIDPGILQLGKEHHPDHPYADERVHIHNTDGREFLRNSPKKYDLILFALPDS